MVRKPTPHQALIARRIQTEFNKGTSPADALKLVEAMWDAQKAADETQSEHPAEVQAKAGEVK
ncbi:hypothetical protein [Pararhizobium sp.]|uniref:hypothetical protein n=1 Tax=Pararhizobium sp. TaxID=1977563 RepID=UPI002724D306|nr:hypothetical protein [Pararhizobium sp.]MDO9415511.1 hypothetical protein [Pararhizobium sp.]